MLRIFFIAKSRKENPEEYSVRFRLRDGRKADISHKSDIKATKEDLDKFTPYGELQPRISVYNRDLFDAINQEIDLMRKAYEKMQEKGMDMLSIARRINRRSSLSVKGNSPIPLAIIKRI